MTIFYGLSSIQKSMENNESKITTTPTNSVYGARSKTDMLSGFIRKSPLAPLSKEGDNNISPFPGKGGMGIFVNCRSSITRRGFLKATSLGAGILSLSPGLLDFKAWAKTQNDAPVTRIPTFCNGCGNRCSIFAYVRSNRIWKIEGNPEANGNRGVICPKGHGYIHDLYNPNRIRSPLKRVNDRFEPISWEQAYKEIATRINLILMDNGPPIHFLD